MKIGLVVPGFSANERDWCIPALLNFVRQLATEHCVHVFALEYPYRRDHYSVYGATIHSLGGANRGKAYAPRLWSNTLAAIHVEHRRARFDVLHAFWANEPGAIATFAGRALRIPVIVSVAGGELIGLKQIDYGGQLHLLERTIIDWTMRATNHITVGSYYLQTIAACWRSDARILPLGVDAQMFSPGEHRERGNALTILNVGSLLPVKNQIELLNAFVQLHRYDMRLEIIGAGHLERKLRAQAKLLGIENGITFAGALPHDALPSRYRQADLVVQTSLHEAQGMAVLEAAACGIPIVGTAVGILPELVPTQSVIARSVLSGTERSEVESKDRDEAIPNSVRDCFAALAMTGTADNLASAIEHTLQAREQMGRCARQAVKENFSLEATWNGWSKLYQQIQRT